MAVLVSAARNCKAAPNRFGRVARARLAQSPVWLPARTTPSESQKQIALATSIPPLRSTLQRSLSRSQKKRKPREKSRFRAIRYPKFLLQMESNNHSKPRKEEQ